MDNQQQIQVQPLLYKNNNSINSLPNQKNLNQGDYNENFETQKQQSQNRDSQNQDSQTKNIQNDNKKNGFISGNQFQNSKANQQQKQQQKQKISARNSQSSQNTDNNINNKNKNNKNNNDNDKNNNDNNSQIYQNQEEKGGNFKKIQYDFFESETENQEEEKMLQELKQLMKEIQIEFKLGLAREGLQKANEIIYRAEKELNSVHYQEIFEDLIKQLNYSSIDVLNQGHLDQALIVLNQCDLLIENNPMDHIELKVLTLNHLGCIYRRGNSFEQAFSCLNNAQQLVYQNQLKEYAGLTYLNLSALFSQVGNHNSALENAQKAKTLQLQEFEEYLKNQSEQEKLEYNFDKNAHNSAQNYLQNQDYLNKATTLIICHHNIASELEYFQQLDEALQNYEESCKLAQSHLGYIHPITQTFRQEYQDFQIRYAQKKISDQNKRFRDKIQDQKQRDVQYIDLVSSLVQGGYAKNSNNFRKILIKKHKKNKSFSKKNFQQLMNQEQNRQRKQIYLQKQPEIQFQKQQISSQNTSFKTNFQRSRPLTGQKSVKNSSQNKLILDGIYSPNQRQQMFQKNQNQNGNQNINLIQSNKRLIRPNSSINFKKELNFFNSSNSKNFDIFNPNSQNNNIVSQNNSYFSTFQLKPHTSNTTPKNQFMTQKNLTNSIKSNKTKSLKPLSMDYNIYNQNKQSQNQNQNLNQNFNQQQSQFQSKFFQTSQNKQQQEKNVSQNQFMGQNQSQNQSASRTKLLSSLKYQYQVCQENMKSIEEKIIFELEKQEKNKQLAQNQKILQQKAKPNQFIIHQKNSSALQKPYDFQIIFQKFDAKIPYLQEKKEESGRIQVAMSIQKSQIEIQFIPKDLQQQKLSHFLNISDLISNLKNLCPEASPSNSNKKITNISQKFSELIIQCLMINRENQKLVINLESPKSKLQVDTEQVPATVYIESQNLTLEIIQKNQNNTILLLQQPEENSDLKEDEISQIQPIFAKNYLEEKEQQENQSSQNLNQKEKEKENQNDSESEIQPIFSSKKQETEQNENSGKQEEYEKENEYEDEIYDDDDFEKTEEQSLNPKSSQNSNYNYNYQNGNKLDQVVKKTTSQTVKRIQFDNYNDLNQKKSSEIEKLQQNENNDLVKQEQQIKVESNYNFKPFKQQKKTQAEPINQQENKQQVKNEKEKQNEDYQQDSFIKEQNDSNINSQQFNSSQILVKSQEDNQQNFKVDENKSENEELVKTLNIKKEETQNGGNINEKENGEQQDQKEKQNQNVYQINSQSSSQKSNIQENNSNDKINTETQKTQEEQEKKEKLDQNNDDLTLQQQEDKELEQAAQLIQKKFRQQQEKKQKQSQEQVKQISQNSDRQENFQEKEEEKIYTLQSQNEDQDNQSDKKEFNLQDSGNLSENSQKQEEKQSESEQNSGSNSDSEKSEKAPQQISNPYQAHSIASSYLTSLNFAVLNQVRNSQPKIQFQKQLEQIQQNQNYNLNLNQNQNQEQKRNTISSQNSDQNFQNQEEGDVVEQQAKIVVNEYLLTLTNTVLKQVESLLQKKEKENVLKIDHNQPIPPLRQHITEQDEETERSQQQSQINYVQNQQQQEQQEQNFYEENKLTTQMSELQNQNSLENEQEDQNKNKEKQQGFDLELEQEKAAAYIQKIYREKKQGQNINLGENDSKKLENPQITVESSEIQRENYNDNKMQEINKNNNNDDSQQEEEEEEDDDDGNVQVQLQKGSNKNILIKKNNLNKQNKRAANAQYHF